MIPISAQGVYKRGLDVNASSDSARDYGVKARQLTRDAWGLARG